MYARYSNTELSGGTSGKAAPVNDGVHQDLDGVLVCEQVNDLKGVLDDAHSHHLLAVVAPMLHQRVRHPACEDNAHIPSPNLSICIAQVSPLQPQLLSEIADIALPPSSPSGSFSMRVSGVCSLERLQR